MKRTSSQIVTAFTQANQEFEINQSKLHFDQITNEIKERRKQIIEKQGRIQKETVVSSSKEKFKTMVLSQIPLEELEKQLQADLINGLSSVSIPQRVREHGKNQLSEQKQTPWYVKLLHEFTGFFAILLWIGSALCFIAYGLQSNDPSNLYLGIVLAIVNFLTGTITYFQNSKSEAIMEGFKNFIPPETQVLRDGKQMKINAQELVPGDIVIVEYGKRIPADIRILVSNEMKVDNSSLTGESNLQSRSIQCSHPDNPLETKNLAFFGTLCKEGSGKGIVIFTGDKTVIGQIANLAANAETQETPLRKELNLFIKVISIFAIFLGLLFFLIGLAYKYDVINSIVFAIGLIVGNVPEGLLATVTVALSLTANKLAKRKVMVKNLEGVETLGSTTCICSDKTGTLTQNKMTVEHLWFNKSIMKGLNQQKKGNHFQNFEYDSNDSTFKMLNQCAVISSEAQFDIQLPQDQGNKIQHNNAYTSIQKEEKLAFLLKNWQLNLENLNFLDRPTIGDASESALIKFFMPIEDINHTRSKYKVGCDEEHKPLRMPFNSTNKYAFVIVEYKTEDSDYCLMTKGAPEKIWTLCDKVYNNGQTEQKNSQWEKDFNDVNLTFGKQGERVLGFAKLHLPRSEYPIGYNFKLENLNFPFTQQAFIGLISLIDPPKDNVPDAVLKCKTAGIQVIMVTGDQPVTATAIARQCNIITEKTANEIAEEFNIPFEEACRQSDAIVIHGDRLTKMAIDDEGLPEQEKGALLNEWLSKSQIVFARTSPAQKLIIVQGCQKRGHIVAVTGDGVNDSPAIKKADIGIAMGIAGSDVAKDAADMILLDDDFSSIVIGIEEGRKLFDNLKKVISYVLSSNVPEILPFISFIIFQFPLPLSTILILCIDLLTDVTPSIGFAYEEAELDIMTRKPRSQQDRLVNSKMITFAYLQQGYLETIGGFLSYFIIMNDFGFPANSLYNMALKPGYQPKFNQQIYKDNDIYDPTDPWLGNTNLKQLYINRVNDSIQGEDQNFCHSSDFNKFTEIEWIFRLYEKSDLRMTFVECDTDTGRWKEAVEWGECLVNQISPISQRPICWHTDALKYAHTGFFFSVVWTQVSNYSSCRTIKLSIIYQGMRNPIQFMGYYSQLLFTWTLAYIIPFNLAFGTRDVIFTHFGITSLPFSLFIIIWNESRKYMIINKIRNWPSEKKNLPNWWVRCVQY